MAIPNLAATATSYGVTKVRELTTSWLTVTGNAGGSMTSYDPIPAEYSAKIHTLIITNIDGTNAADVTVGIDKATRTSAATGSSVSGALFKIASTVSVPADAVLVLADTPIYLEEGDVLEGGASAASDLTLFVSYEVIDDA